MSTPFDPYQILNVRRNASRHAIDKAFRKLARAAHPDCAPGDATAAARFQDLRRARDILVDPARRARYDATGQADDAAPDNAQAQVLAMLAQTLAATVAELLKQRQDLRFLDVAAHMKECLRQHKKDLAARYSDLGQSQKALALLAGRFTRAQGDNCLEGIVASHLAEITAVIGKLEGQMALADRALLELDSYQFRQDIRAYAATATAAATTSGATAWRYTAS